MNHCKIALALTLVIAGSCHRSGSSGSLPPNTGLVLLDLSDEPFAHEIAASARVRIDRVLLSQEIGAEAAFVTAYDGAPIEVDVLTLRNGVTHALTQVQVPAGTWREVRVHFAGGRLELLNGNVYTTDDGTLELAEQDEFGFAVPIEPAIDVVAGSSTRVLLDVDLTRTFHPVPIDGDPTTATSYRLRPAIHAVLLPVMGEIRGVVMQDDGEGGQIPLSDATLYFLSPDDPNPEHCRATTPTGTDGSYAKLGLPPGVYDVKVEKGSLKAVAFGNTVTAGGTTVVDIEVH